jgi:hypothetical protein
MPQQVTADERAECDRAWSPDGNSLAFADCLWGLGVLAVAQYTLLIYGPITFPPCPARTGFACPAGCLTDDTSLHCPNRKC